MTEQDLLRLIKAAHEREVEEFANHLAEERAACLPIMRARALALKPARMTPGEQAHVAACGRCARLLEKFRRNLAHPPLETLIRWLKGTLNGEESRLLRDHLDTDECQRCLLLAHFEEQRPRLLCQALDDAKKWCAAPCSPVDGRRSDQFWLRLFSSTSETVTADDAQRFLVSFKLATRVAWDKDAVAGRIMALRRQEVSDVPAAVDALANDLRGYIRSRNRGVQTSAASKIAFFAKPLQEVYIWDQFARRSARFRDWRRAGGGIEPPRFDRPYTDYASYATSCAKALEEERQRDDFATAVRDFQGYLRGVGGPMSDRIIMSGSSFVERRFLDKLMFMEGQWLADFTPKSSYKRGERGNQEDRFGNRIGSQAARINAALGKAPKTAESVSEETGLSVQRVKSHFRWLRKHGHGRETEAGFVLEALPGTDSP